MIKLFNAISLGMILGACIVGLISGILENKVLKIYPSLFGIMCFVIYFAVLYFKKRDS